MTPASVSTIALAIAIPLVIWRLYSRMRRLVGRQRSRAGRHWAAVVIWPLLFALVAFAAIADPVAEAALAAGIVAGAALSVWGLRLTRFEPTAEGFFYTPNARIGIALTAIFAARVVYRLGQLYAAGGAPHSTPHDLARSPLTLAILGTLGAYYVGYAVGLLRWRRAQRLAAPPA